MVGAFLYLPSEKPQKQELESLSKHPALGMGSAGHHPLNMHASSCTQAPKAELDEYVWIVLYGRTKT